MKRITLILLATLALVAVACDDDGGGGNGDDPTRLEQGESLGTINRFPGGTQVAEDPRTFLDATCDGGELTIRTASETLTSEMDCDQMLGPEVIGEFRDKPVAIRYDQDRLVVESPGVGTMTLPASEPHIEPAADDAS